MERRVQITADGSHTIAIPGMQVTYHSKHGAIEESKHVFIEAGLYYPDKHRKKLSVLEMGFGTGLNALLTAIEAQQNNIDIQYHAIEAYPLSSEEKSALNHGALLNQETIFQQLHDAPWNQPVLVHPYFSLHKHYSTLQSFQHIQAFDVIYYDAFAPSAQPELWTVTVFQQLLNLLTPGGLLVTYCSKGDVRRAMTVAGFHVTKIPGPPGKREMVRAFRNA